MNTITGKTTINSDITKSPFSVALLFPSTAVNINIPQNTANTNILSGESANFVAVIAVAFSDKVAPKRVRLSKKPPIAAPVALPIKVSTTSGTYDNGFTAIYPALPVNKPNLNTIIAHKPKLNKNAPSGFDSTDILTQQPTHKNIPDKIPSDKNDIIFFPISSIPFSFILSRQN